MTSLLAQRKNLEQLYAAGALSGDEFNGATAALIDGVEDAELAPDLPEPPPAITLPRPLLMQTTGAAIGVSLVLLLLGTPASFALPIGLAAALGVLIKDTAQGT